jgi:hypothetical protein
MVSFYISQAGKAAVERLATETGQTKADTYRALLQLGLQHATKPVRPKRKAVRTVTRKEQV